MEVTRIWSIGLKIGDHRKLYNFDSESHALIRDEIYGLWEDGIISKLELFRALGAWRYIGERIRGGAHDRDSDLSIL